MSDTKYHVGVIVVVDWWNWPGVFFGVMPFALGLKGEEFFF